MAKELKLTTIEKFSTKYDENKAFKVSSNSVKKNGVFNASYDDSYLASVSDVYSNTVKDIGKITNQKSSGRCWMFAAFNVLRKIVCKNLKVEDFEFSGAYIYFYDKLEKANHYLELILNNLDEDDQSRKMSYIKHEGPAQDGGFWHFFTSLVDKYGVVPLDAMKETASCENSNEMDEVLDNLIVKYTSNLRNDYKKGIKLETLKRRKEIYLQEIYNVLTICLGKPISSFVFEYEEKEDEDKKEDKKESKEKSKTKDEKKDKDLFRRIKTTPKKFYEDYIKEDLDNYVSIMNYPTTHLPFNKLYEYEFTNNVEGGRKGRFINLDLDIFKKIAVDAIKDDNPLWFACDVLAFSSNKEGYLIKGLFDIESTFDVDLKVSKGDRILYYASFPSHAMTFTGVNLVDDKPNRWKVMNSWGEDYGFKGYFMMNDAWFDEYVYEIVVNKKYLPKNVLKILDTEPTILPYFTPFCRKCD